MLAPNSLKNYLLLKDDVGKSKPTTRDLPTLKHVYGHAAIPDKEGVGACKSKPSLHFNTDYVTVM